MRNRRRTANESTQTAGLARRTVLKASALGTALTSLEMAGQSAIMPMRSALAVDGSTDPNFFSVLGSTLSDIQYNISPYLPPAKLMANGVYAQLPPVHTVFLTAALVRTPTVSDQSEMNYALDTIEATYPFSPSGIFTFVSYGLPYFDMLPGGRTGAIFSGHVPVLNNDPTRFVLEEATPSPTDVNGDPGQVKMRYNVSTVIERNAVLFTLRSDDSSILADVINWLGGSGVLAGTATRSPAFAGLLTFTSSRAQFVQVGLPRTVADTNNLPYAPYVNNNSPMWMGFGDQQVGSAGPAQITTFQGNPSARLTTAKAGDYFDNGSIQHLSHDIIDMLQWFDMAFPTSSPGEDGTFTERVQYMFHSPQVNAGNQDQFTDGGGPAWLFNDFRGPHYANMTAVGVATNGSEHRVGHLSTLQRSSRAVDGTPMHIRMDGPGFDAMDVPDGTSQPKLQFTVFVPTAAFFQTMRANQSAQDLHVSRSDNGLERFITATRRQNFLVPPRRHRAFPLVEFA